MNVFIDVRGVPLIPQEVQSGILRGAPSIICIATDMFMWLDLHLVCIEKKKLLDLILALYAQGQCPYRNRALYGLPSLCCFELD